METERLRHSEGEGGRRAVSRAAMLLRAGGLVAFPTETVYGLGALALDEAALAQIFMAKARPATHPLIVHVENAAQARALAAAWPETAERLVEAFWPGPLTIVVPRAAHVPSAVSAGLPTLALRAPSHPLALELLRAVGAPLAAPSANRYTTISPTSAAHVLKTLDGRIDAVLDGGATSVGIESTVIDLTGERPVILRPGLIARVEIERSIGAVDLHEVAAVEDERAHRSPGLSVRHYAPTVPTRLVRADELSSQLTAEDGVLTRRPRPEGEPGAVWLQLPADPEGFARQLYGALHALEDSGVAQLLIEEVPSDASWSAVRDRLVRACG